MAEMRLNPLTTLALGEEVTTLALGEEVTTQALGEENPTTTAYGEESVSARGAEQRSPGGPFGAF